MGCTTSKLGTPMARVSLNVIAIDKNKEAPCNNFQFLKNHADARLPFVFIIPDYSPTEYAKLS